MRITAYILLLSLTLMGVNRFMHGMQTPVHLSETSSELDCCDSHDDCDQEEEKSSHNDTCPPGCDCDCCFHITAIEYQFISVPRATIQSFYFRNYSVNYQFEYSALLFQPPRIG